MTQFGRGGGASTSPCGWFVVYTHEQPGPTTQLLNSATAAAGIAIANEDGYPAIAAKATIHMWTDNSLMLLASSSMLSLATAILF
jgi:hypothetical protein